MANDFELIRNLQNEVSASLADAREARATAARLEGQLAAQRAETAKAAAAERSRIKGILTCPEAEGRTAQAQSLAFESAMDEALAAKILGAQPKEAGAARILTIAERAEQQGSAGMGFDVIGGRRAATDPMADAVAAINKGAKGA